MFLPEGGDSYQLQAHQAFVFPSPQANPPPDFPPEYAERELPPLYAATVASVRQRRFDPAMFCAYPDATTRDRDWNGRRCSGAVAEARIVPVSLSYAFTFEVKDGRARIGAAKRQAN